MSLLDLVMPKLGESIMEATILRWHKKPGDPVKMDETILDIATDKVDSEVPSTAEGVIEEILYKENDIVPIGAVLARIRTSDSTSVADSNHRKVALNENKTEEISGGLKESHIQEQINDIPYQPSIPVQKPATTGKFYSPLVLNIASNEGISLSELEKIPGTGNEGRVTKKDILDYLQRRSGPSTQPIQYAAPQSDAATQHFDNGNNDRFVQEQIPQRSYSGNVEIIEMDRMRKYIAEHMIKSKSTSAHVTSFAEADVTALVQWREEHKASFEKREGEKITVTPLILEAVIKSLKKFPLINSSVEGDKIIIRKDINIGLATALPSGNLVVPVIKSADQLNLVGLTRQVNQLAHAARSNKLKPDDTQGGTFTFTNVGIFGSLMGTPIINQPQVAILASGTIKKRPVVLETEQGDCIAIRHMMYLSLSYDHRIIDGALGSSFLSTIVKELEQFNPQREI